MFRLRKPTDDFLEGVRAAYRETGWSYAEVGRTRTGLPSGYVVDRNRARLGSGRATFERARQALQTWQMLRLGWIEPCWPDAPCREKEPVATLTRARGLWVVNVCRIVYVIDQPEGPHPEFAFAYGTLAGHVEQGEERFRIVWNRDDDAVWYEILAISRPGHWLTRLGYPYVRGKQCQFARDSMRRMQESVA